MRIFMILASLAVFIVGALIWTTKPVQTKFTSANQKVVHDVTFGSGGGSYDYIPAKIPAHRQAPPSEAPPAPTEAPASDNERVDGAEVLNHMRETRSVKKYARRSVKPGAKAIVQRSERSEDTVKPIRPAPPLEPEALAAPARAKRAAGDVNPMTLVAEDALSTFSIDVDTGSYTLARRMINEGYAIDPARVRVEEFLNYFHYRYPEPQAGAFGVSLDAAPSLFKPAANRKMMRVGVQGKQLSAATRKPVHLSFLVDVSGSMQGANRIGLVREALRVVTWNLGAGDTISITTYAGEVKVLLPPTGMMRRGDILEVINGLKTTGSTRMGDGLQLVYKMALDSFVPGDVNRVIVLSDGDANLGPTSFSKMFERIQAYVAQGITLTTIGFGMGNYKDEMMEQLANQGNGNYFYIDTKKEVYKVFEEQLDATLQVIAKDVKIQVEFNPEAVVSYRLVGYENRDIADADFRDDRVDAGEIGAGHSVTALYEMVLTDAALESTDAHLATVRIRHKTPTGTQAQEQAFELSARQLHATLAEAGDDFCFAAAVAGFAEVLRKSPYAADLDLAQVEELARAASLPEQEQRQEFIGLVAQIRARRPAR